MSSPEETEALTEGFDEEAQVGEGEEGEEKKNTLWKTGKSRIVMLAALGSFGLNVTSIVFNHGYIGIIAASVAIVIAPLIIYQEYQLEDIDTLREIQNQLRKSVNVFAQQNKELALKNDKLQVQVEGLKGVEQDLQNVAEEQGQDMDYLVGLVEEHEKLVEQTTEITFHQLNQTIIDVLVGIDKDRSQSIEDAEIERVIYRLRSESNRVKVNEDLLRERIKADPTFLGLLKLTKDLKNTDKPDEERVFILLQPEDENV